MERLKVAVLVSGRGSNLQALIDACATGGFPAQIVRVISNVPDAGGLARARAAGIADTTIDHRGFETRTAFERELADEIERAGADLVCLAGFMRLLTESFVARWTDRLVNIHPSLLPAYKGLHTHERVLADGVRFTGCTVHFVRPAMDAGPIIVQAAVPVLPADDADSLAARVLAAEHRCYPLAVRLIAERRVTVADERVVIEGAVSPAEFFLNPADATSSPAGS